MIPIGGDTNNDLELQRPLQPVIGPVSGSMQLVPPPWIMCSSAMPVVIFGLNPRKAFATLVVHSALHNSTIEFGGGSAIRSDTNGVIDIQDSLIQNNTEHGLYYSATGAVHPIIKNNTFTSNTSYRDLLQSPRYAHPGWHSNEREHRPQQWHQRAAPGWHFGRHFHPEWRPRFSLCARWNNTRSLLAVPSPLSLEQSSRHLLKIVMVRSLACRWLEHYLPLAPLNIPIVFTSLRDDTYQR